MNILYNIQHKGKIALLFLVLIILVAFNCNTYNTNITEMGDSFSEVYSDRLLAQDYIYKLSDKIHENKLQLAKDKDREESRDLSEKSVMLDLIDRYEKTKLTDAELILFKRFRQNTLTLFSLEKKILETGNPVSKHILLTSYEKSMNVSLSLLKELSEIQLSRGKDLSDNSKKIVSFSYVINQFNWALIIIVGLMIQALVFAERSTLSKLRQEPHLN